jgi:hypothetical protein
MAQTDTIARTEYKPHELLEAGASCAFVRYYEAAKLRNERTPAVNHVESEFNTLEDTAEAPSHGEGFFESLWNDEPRASRSVNPYGADTRNARILAEAGVEPYVTQR